MASLPPAKRERRGWVAFEKIKIEKLKIKKFENLNAKIYLDDAFLVW